MKIKTAKRLYHISKAVCIIAGLVSFFLIIWAAGSFENNSTTFIQSVLTEALGFVCCFISYVAFIVKENCENYLKMKMQKHRGQQVKY